MSRRILLLAGSCLLLLSLSGFAQEKKYYATSNVWAEYPCSFQRTPQQSSPGSTLYKDDAYVTACSGRYHAAFALDDNPESLNIWVTDAATGELVASRNWPSPVPSEDGFAFDLEQGKNYAFHIWIIWQSSTPFGGFWLGGSEQ